MIMVDEYRLVLRKNERGGYVREVYYRGKKIETNNLPINDELRLMTDQLSDIFIGGKVMRLTNRLTLKLN